MFEENETIITKIMDELRERNEAICDEQRPEDRLRSDAEHVYMHEHGGISIETMAMMLTDLKFALKEIRGNAAVKSA